MWLRHENAALQVRGCVQSDRDRAEVLFQKDESRRRYYARKVSDIAQDNDGINQILPKRHWR